MQLRSIHLSPEDTTILVRQPKPIAAKVSRAVGNLGAPLGPFDENEDLDVDAEEEAESGDTLAPVSETSKYTVVYSNDPLSYGLGLEEMWTEKPSRLVAS